MELRDVNKYVFVMKADLITLLTVGVKYGFELRAGVNVFDSCLLQLEPTLRHEFSHVMKDLSTRKCKRLFSPKIVFQYSLVILLRINEVDFHHFESNHDVNYKSISITEAINFLRKRREPHGQTNCLGKYPQAYR